MKNNILIYGLIILLFVGIGKLYYKIDKVDRTVQGLSILVVMTNPEAGSLVKALMPASAIKDPALKDRVFDREVGDFISKKGGLFGDRAKAS